MVLDQELKELDLWVRNTWDVEERELFYSTIFRLNSKESVRENEREIEKLHELISKKYEEYAEEYVKEIYKHEEAIKDTRIEAEELEAKLNNKENYLIKNFPITIINANLQNVIDNCNKMIEQHTKEKEELIQKLEEEKDNFEERLKEIEDELSDLRVKNVSVTTDEELDAIREKYNSLLEEKESINKTLKEYEDGTIEAKLEEIDRKLKFEEIKAKKYQELKEENLKYANETQYDQRAIKEDESKLAELKSKIEEVEKYQINNGNTDYLDVFDRYVKSKENPIFDEEPVKVVASKTWQWVKDHKKQILIALGLTALAVSVVVLATQVLPALVAASEATQTAGLLSQMVTNGSLWHTASVGEQVALHAANVGLANQVTAVSGMANAFNATTGIWTIGGQTLSAAASTAAATAANAAGTASLLQGLAAVTGIGGVGLIGAGLLQNPSQEYKTINVAIKELRSKCELIEESEFQMMAEQIDSRITKSNELSAIEKKFLLKKFSWVLRKRAKFITRENESRIEAELYYGDTSCILEEAKSNKFIEAGVKESSLNTNPIKAIDENGNEVEVEMLENAKTI